MVVVSQISPEGSAHSVHTHGLLGPLYPPVLNELGMGKAAGLGSVHRVRTHMRLGISHHSPALNKVGMRLGIRECELSIVVSQVAPLGNAHGVRTHRRLGPLYLPALDEVVMGKAAKLGYVSPVRSQLRLSMRECGLTVVVSRVSPSNSAYGARTPAQSEVASWYTP